MQSCTSNMQATEKHQRATITECTVPLVIEIHNNIQWFDNIKTICIDSAYIDNISSMPFFNLKKQADKMWALTQLCHYGCLLNIHIFL